MAIAATGSEDEHKEMKEGKGDKDDDSSSSNNKNKYRGDELEVADVLLQLRSSISITNNNQFEYKWKLKLNLKWGAKKPRSALLNPPINNNNNNNYCKHILKQPQQAPSPTTPLSFSPTTQTPYKFTAPLHLRKQELKEAVEQKLQTQHQLKQSILKVKEYLNTIMAENSALKAHKRLLVNNGEKEDRKKMKLAPMTKQGSSGLQVVQQPPFDNHHIQDVNHHQLKQHPPLIHPRHHYHHGAAVAVWMNDPLYAPTPLHLHYPQQQQQQQQPLIHHQAYPMLQYNHHHHRSQQQQQQQQKQHVVHIDLNVLPSAEDEHIIKRVEAQEARKNRMRVNKDKKTRVP